MPKAIWHDTILAESNDTIVVEGNHCFPPDSVNWDYLQQSSTHTTCHWKGQASYYDALVDGKVNKDAAWYYPQPSAAASHIKDHVAFWHGVRVVANEDGAEQSLFQRMRNAIGV